MTNYIPPNIITLKILKPSIKITEELIKLEFDEKNKATLMLRKKKRIKTDESDFAIVFYTPYDKGRGITEANVHTRDRAKQNIVFEHDRLMVKVGIKNG